MSSHVRLIGARRAERLAAWERATPPGVAIVSDCHRRLRGVYTGVNTLLRQLVPPVYRAHPDIVDAHATEILYAAPELNDLIDAAFRPIPVDVHREHRRFFIRAYSTVRPLLVTHSLVTFVRKCAAVLPHLSVLFENVHAADELDHQFLTVLLRRVAPGAVTVGVGAADEPLPDDLAAALDRHTVPLPVPEQARPLSPRDNTVLARMFVDSDGTSDLPEVLAAYAAAAPDDRRRWHDERAEWLEQRNDFGSRLGAIPYHRANGVFPDTLGALAYRQATEYVTDVGYYEAAVHIGNLGRALVDRETQLSEHRSLFLDQDIPLLVLRRTDEARTVYQELRAHSAEPGVQAHAAYGIAMLYVRFYPPEQRDLTEARAWLNTALALARTLPEAHLRTHLTAFEQNGLALVEYRLGRFDEAIRLETEAMALLDAQPGPHRYELYLRRALLAFNRAQVYTAVGRHDDAVTDLTSVVDLFPYESDGYLERGNAHRRAGRPDEALADYDRAITYNPPPEAYYNRAGLLVDLGRLPEALADYNTVLDLDPDHVDTLVNRAELHHDLGDHDLSLGDVEHGLSLAPDNARLLCTRGLLESATGRREAAKRSFTSAIEHDPTLAAAWVNRAVLVFDNGDPDSAIADLTEALSLGNDPMIRYNRAVALQQSHQWEKAAEDFTHALQLGADNEEDILARTAACHRALSEQDG